MDEFMLSNLTCYRPGMGWEWVIGGGFGASALEKQCQGQNATTLNGLSPIQPNWKDWGRIVAPISELCTML